MCRWDLSQKMYSEDAIFYHPLFVVKGKENIFGAHMFWASINRKTDARVKRIGLFLGMLTQLNLVVCIAVRQCAKSKLDTLQEFIFVRN